jgi:hypothetical protein
MTLWTPEYLQTQTYPAIRVRRMLSAMRPGIAEGMIDEASMKVTQRGAGANMSVDVAAGEVFVQGDDTAGQGTYHVVNDAAVNVVIAAAHGSLPRVDQIVCRVYDSTVVGGSDVPLLEVVQGTATAGAQSTDPDAANYRLGAAALPNGAMLLADVQVDAAAASIVTAKIRDKRQRRSGVCSIATEEARTNTAYGKLTTPDEVANIVLPTDGLIVVGYHAAWKNSVDNVGRAAIFLNGNQLKVNVNGSSIQNSEANGATGTGYSQYGVVASTSGGLNGSGGYPTPYAGPSTTGQAIMAALSSSSNPNTPGGPCFIFAAAGTYDVSVRFKSSSGTVTAKERKLWVFTLDPTRPLF